MNPDIMFRHDMIITFVCYQDDMLKLIYYDMRYHNNYRLTLGPLHEQDHCARTRDQEG